MLNAVQRCKKRECLPVVGPEHSRNEICFLILSFESKRITDPENYSEVPAGADQEQVSIGLETFGILSCIEAVSGIGATITAHEVFFDL